MVAHNPWRAVIVTGVAIVTLGACGAESTPTASSDETPATPASSPSGETGPACADVWKADADLPSGYSGCTDTDASWVAPDVLECSSGQRIVRFDDRYWALRGHVIGEAPKGLDRSRAYRAVMRSCRA